MFPAKEKVSIGEMQVVLLFFKFVAFQYFTEFDIINCLHLLKPFSLIIEEIDIIVKK